MILLLAGTSEARALAAALARQGTAAMASLAGATREPHALALPTRVGGFGGAEGFGAFLDREGVRAVIDATHPFAARIGPRTAAICARRGLPCLRLERPGWQPGPGDRWTWIDGPAEAAALIPPGASVMLITGRQGIGDWAGMADRRLWLRVIDPPDAPFPYQGGWLVGRPPFTVATEIDTLRRIGADWLVAKDSGAAEARAKLDAARALDLPVAMIRRPQRPPVPTVATVEAALDWVAAL